jgi:hypothetical protein
VSPAEWRKGGNVQLDAHYEKGGLVWSPVLERNLLSLQGSAGVLRRGLEAVLQDMVVTPVTFLESGVLVKITLLET